MSNDARGVFDLQLRDYQKAAVVDIETALDISGRALFELPTGGGKTTIFSEITSRAFHRGQRVLIIAHRRELIEQASARLNRFELDAGLIISGEEMAPERRVSNA